MDELKSLPKGYISRKVIRGKEVFYHQWKENGKVKSKYLRHDEVEGFREQIRRRHAIQEILLKEGVSADESSSRNGEAAFETDVKTDVALRAFAKGVEKWDRREALNDILKYVRGDTIDRVMIVYGLRRTGKTTMLRQAICESSDFGTKEAFSAILKTVCENGLVRFSAVKRAAAVWLGALPETGDAERVTQKTVDLMYSLIKDPSACRVYIASEDTVKILCGLWRLAYDDAGGALSAAAKIALDGSIHQRAAAGFFCRSLGLRSVATVALSVIEKYKDELKQAAEDKRKDGDSAESKKLIDDAVDAIESAQ